MNKKELAKKVVLVENKEGEPLIVKDEVLIVKDWDEMLKLLDMDYEVAEELIGDMFLMRKKKLSREPSPP